jgi:hypothetical protein
LPFFEELQLVLNGVLADNVDAIDVVDDEHLGTKGFEEVRPVVVVEHADDLAAELDGAPGEFAGGMAAKGCLSASPPVSSRSTHTTTSSPTGKSSSVASSSQ